MHSAGMPIHAYVDKELPLPKTTATGDYIGVRSRLIHIDALIRKGDFARSDAEART